ncbi:hypothetical protein CSUI_004299 [Cystoisospora suis]|uniref:Uncharacterized protein n=1 Tax=Cystoisospora suis TaxID=483139 RepID=A0A2C6L1N8_9APIC|nr:hypothetical protein CSUI_004299 [Cystoisospora suis]
MALPAPARAAQHHSLGRRDFSKGFFGESPRLCGPPAKSLEQLFPTTRRQAPRIRHVGAVEISRVTVSSLQSPRAMKRSSSSFVLRSRAPHSCFGHWLGVAVTKAFPRSLAQPSLQRGGMCFTSLSVITKQDASQLLQCAVVPERCLRAPPGARGRCDVAALPPWKRWPLKQRARLAALSGSSPRSRNLESASNTPSALDVRGLLFLANASLVQRIQRLQRARQIRLLPDEKRASPRLTQGPSEAGEGVGRCDSERGKGTNETGNIKYSSEARSGKEVSKEESKPGEHARQVGKPQSHSPGNWETTADGQAGDSLQLRLDAPSSCVSASPFFILLDPVDAASKYSRRGGIQRPLLFPNFYSLLEAAKPPSSPSSLSRSSPAPSRAEQAISLIVTALIAYVNETAPFLPELAVSSPSAARDEDETKTAALVLRSTLHQTAALLRFASLSPSQALSLFLALTAVTAPVPFDRQKMPQQIEQERLQRNQVRLQKVLVHPAAKRLLQQLLATAAHGTAYPPVIDKEGFSSLWSPSQSLPGHLSATSGLESPCLSPPPASPTGAADSSEQPSPALNVFPEPGASRIVLPESAVLPVLEACWKLRLRQHATVTKILEAVATEELWLDEHQVVRLCTLLAFYERPGFGAALVAYEATDKKHPERKNKLRSEVRGVSSKTKYSTATPGATEDETLLNGMLVMASKNAQPSLKKRDEIGQQTARHGHIMQESSIFHGQEKQGGAAVFGPLSAATFKIFDLVGHRLRDRFDFFTDDDVGDVCRALVLMKQNHDKLLLLKQQQQRAGRGCRPAPRVTSGSSFESVCDEERSESRGLIKSGDIGKGGCFQIDEDNAVLQPLQAYFDIWKRPVGIALERHLPLVLHDFRYWNLIDVGEMVAEFQTRKQEELTKCSAVSPLNTMRVTEEASEFPEGCIEFLGSPASQQPAVNVIASTRRLGDLPGVENRPLLVPPGFAPGLFGYAEETHGSFQQGSGQEKGRELAERIANEVWKFSVMMKFGYTGKALTVLHKLNVGNPRTQRSLLRHVTKMFGFRWSGNFFGEITVAAATAAYRAGLPVNRQKKGVHVAGWHFYNNLALYLLQPCDVINISASEPYLQGSVSYVGENSEQDEGKRNEGEHDEGEFGSSLWASPLPDSSETPSYVSTLPLHSLAGSSCSSPKASDTRRAKATQRGKRTKRFGRLLDTISSPMLCCEIAASLALVGVPQPALLHAMVARAEEEGSQWMHLQHLISLMRDMQEVSVHSQRLLKLLLDRERQEAELAGCSPAALALYPFVLGRARGHQPPPTATLVRLHRLLVCSTGPDGVPLPSRSFFSDKDHEWYIKLRTVAEQIKAARGLQRTGRLSLAGPGRSAASADDSPTSLLPSRLPTREGSIHVPPSFPSATACPASSSHAPAVRSSSVPTVLQIRLPSSACSSSVSPLATNTSGESRRVRVRGLADEHLVASAAKARAEEAEEAKRWNDLAAISDSLAHETFPLVNPPETSVLAATATKGIPTQSCSFPLREVAPSTEKGTTDSVAKPDDHPRVTRLQLMSVDDLVVLMRGLELLRCCSTALATETLAVLSRRRAEVTPGHLPALLCGFACLAPHDVKGLGGAAHPCSAVGEREVEQGVASSAAAVQLFDELLSKHVASLSDLEVPACIWGAYAIGLRATQHSPSLLEGTESDALTAAENAADTTQGHTVEISPFNKRVLLPGPPLERKVFGDTGRVTGTCGELTTKETALVKLLRRFLGSSVNLEGPMLHLLQVVALCLRLDALQRPDVQQPEEVARFAQLLEASPLVPLVANFSLSMNSLLSLTGSRNTLTNNSSTSADVPGMQSGGRRTFWEAAVASQSVEVRKGQGARSHRGCFGSEICSSSSFAEVLRLRAGKSQEDVVAALAEHGVPCRPDLPFFPFRIDLALSTPSTFGVHVERSTHGQEDSGAQQESTTGTDTQSNGLLANAVARRAVRGKCREEDFRLFPRKLQFPHAPGEPEPLEPVWRHTWQVPDVGFTPDPSLRTMAGDVSVNAGSNPRKSSGVGKNPVALFVAGSPQALCFRDLQELEKHYQAPDDLLRSAPQPVTNRRNTAEDPTEAELFGTLLAGYIGDVTPKKQRRVLRHLPGDQVSGQMTPGSSRGEAGGQELQGTDLSQGHRSLTLTSSQRLARAGWQLGPYEQLRERILGAFGWHTRYLFTTSL